MPAVLLDALEQRAAAEGVTAPCLARRAVLVSMLRAGEVGVLDVLAADSRELAEWRRLARTEPEIVAARAFRR